MTYVELIVVLSIFSVMSSIVLFNYGKFQAKVDIKNLANDIALKLVEAQKTAMSGKVPANFPSVDPWRPTYGVYFDITNPKTFIYYVDLDQSGDYLFGPVCPGGECLSNITITKNNAIARISYFNGATGTDIVNPLSISFKRPDSSAIFKSNGVLLTGFDYMQIKISSPQEISSYIRIYPSGRIQIN